VKLHPIQDKELNDFTIDFTYEFSEATKDPYFLSYAQGKTKWGNDLLIGQKHGIVNTVRFYEPKGSFAGIPLDIGTTERVTITRINSEVSLYSNGKIITKKNIATPIEAGGSWVLGQDQDEGWRKSVEKSFDKNQRFIGKICDFQIWNYGMNQDSLKKLFLNNGVAGNIFNSPPTYALEFKNGATSSQTCFTFKKEDALAYVKLHPIQDKELNDFTIDFTYEFSEATKDPYFLSYAQGKTKWGNDLLIGQKHGIVNTVRFYEPKGSFAGIPLDIGTTERVTITRINSEVSLYSNGKIITKKNIATPIEAGGSWVLGQDQDEGWRKSVEKTFDKNQRFIGKICNFQIWDYGMNQDSLKKLFLKDGSLNAGNVFDSPSSYAFELKNGAL